MWKIRGKPFEAGRPRRRNIGAAARAVRMGKTPIEKGEALRICEKWGE
ncbi:MULTISPECIES: hypothetical protein [unclassified Burkholderia]|nr:MULTISPECIES: hypothetical protein [unclassified Burkholderia]